MLVSNQVYKYTNEELTEIIPVLKLLHNLLLHKINPEHIYSRPVNSIECVISKNYIKITEMEDIVTFMGPRTKNIDITICIDGDARNFSVFGVTDKVILTTSGVIILEDIDWIEIEMSKTINMWGIL